MYIWVIKTNKIVTCFYRHYLDYTYCGAVAGREGVDEALKPVLVDSAKLKLNFI